MMKIDLNVGEIYFLYEYTAPKMYTGSTYECLYTDQIIAGDAEVERSTGIHINDWEGDICKRERFKYELSK